MTTHQLLKPLPRYCTTRAVDYQLRFGRQFVLTTNSDLENTTQHQTLPKSTAYGFRTVDYPSPWSFFDKYDHRTRSPRYHLSIFQRVYGFRTRRVYGFRARGLQNDDISPPNIPFRTSKRHHLVPGEAAHNWFLRFHSRRACQAAVMNLPGMFAVYGFRAVDIRGTTMSKMTFVISCSSFTCTASERFDIELETT